MHRRSSHPKTARKSSPDPPSRPPEWADERVWEGGPEDDEPDAQSIFKAAPFCYKLDQLAGNQDNKPWPADMGAIKKPVVLVPEDVELQPKRAKFWAAPPLHQYSNSLALGDLVENCYAHLRCTRGAADSFQPYLKP